jgi:hypothetical protein
MRNHISYHPEWANILNEEIIADAGSDWYHPRGNPGGGLAPGDFDYGRMRFVNRNLNYFYFKNMVSHAVTNNFEFNPKYPKFLEFCKNMRVPLNEPGPFGRMCIWKLQAGGFLLPHVDNWDYHRHITRYIFCISNHTGSDVLVKIKNSEIDVSPGLLFNFYPAFELHEFVNNTDRDFYFLGWDYWKPALLKAAIIRTGMTKDTVVPYQEGFGGFNKLTKFMSKE